MKKGNLDIRVYNNRQILGQKAADMVRNKVEELLAEKPNVNMIFA